MWSKHHSRKRKKYASMLVCVCVCKRDREGGNSLDPGKFLTERHNFSQSHGHFITTVIPSQPADRNTHSCTNNLHYSEHNSCVHQSYIIPSVSIKDSDTDSVCHHILLTDTMLWIFILPHILYERTVGQIRSHRAQLWRPHGGKTEGPEKETMFRI